MKVTDVKKHDVLIERLCETFSVLYQGRTIDKNWLCEHFSITERTAYRDLARLARVLDEVSPGRYRLSACLSPDLHIGHLAEFARFAGVAHLFPRSDGRALRNTMNSPQSIAIHNASSRENMVLETLFTQINRAILARTEIRYHYRRKARCVQPYRLINQYGLWYLAAVEQGTLKAYELAQITRFVPDGAIFTPASWVIEELDSTSGIRFGTRQTVQLQVSSRVAGFVRRRPLFPRQRIVQEQPDGGLLLETAINDPDTLFRWLRYWLPDISIVTPQALHEAFEQDLRQRCEIQATPASAGADERE